MAAVTTEQDTTETGQGSIDTAAATALSRRKMFSMCSLGVLGVAGLAACSSSDSTSATDTTEPAPAASSDAAAPATTDAAAGGDAVSLVKLADVPVGSAVSLKVGDDPVIVAQPTTGEAVAFSAVCPHQGGVVALSGKELRCPLHGSTFEIATGKNLTGPAAGKPLPPYPVKVVDGEVVQA